MQHTRTLNGGFITLERFTSDHIPEVQAIALDTAIWKNLPYNITDESSFQLFIDQLKNKNLNEEQVTYVIRNKTNKTVCGCTGFINIDPINRGLEIGPTWLTPTVWGTKINIESKYLLLCYCFEQQHIMRVEFRTRETNIRSQKAIEKIGGIREGLLRCHRINDDRTFRNTIVYSIIQHEWPLAKTALEVLVNN